MSGVYVWVLTFLIIALVALVLVWIYARRVKNDLDSSPSAAAGAVATLQLPVASVQRLRELSEEPILLKQNEQGLRVQIEHRPMMPLMAFVGQDVSVALTEAAARVSEKWGPVWVALVTPRGDSGVLAQRLA